VKHRADRLSQSVAAFSSATLAGRRAALSEAAEFEDELTQLAEAVEAGRAPVLDIRITLLFEDGAPVAPGPYVLRWATAGDRASCRRALCGRPFRVNSPEPRTSLRLNGNYVVWAVLGQGAASCDTPVDPVDGTEPKWEVRIFRNPPPPPARCQQ
ncbi:MAG TPA: hypothetical protein VEQ60_02725, partial [Longimicrobium sp.]|nr:hypothetical protein [Longimicrobium sp.]